MTGLFALYKTPKLEGLVDCSSVVWPLTFDLSGMGDPTRTSKGPASKALRLTATRKPPHHIKVAI